MRSWIIVVASPAPAFTQNLNVESDRSAKMNQGVA